MVVPPPPPSPLPRDPPPKKNSLPYTPCLLLYRWQMILIMLTVLVRA